MNSIYFNGKVLTLDHSRPEVQAVAVENSRIAAIGSNDDICRLKNSKTEMVDLRGRVLMPGFNDSHLHLIGYAMTKTRVDLSQCRSIEQVVTAVQAFIRDNEVPRGKWIYGWGWDHGLFAEGRMPNRQDLDRASSDHSLALVRTCCHLLSCNSSALKEAGLDQTIPLIEGGSVEIDAQGLATGVLKEKAMQLILDLVTPMDAAMLKALIFEAGNDFVAAGLTSVQTDDLAALGSEMLPALLEAYRDLESSGNLPLRINLQLLLMTKAELQAFFDLGYRTGQGSDYFKIGPLKLLSDGSIGGRTAFLSEPYSGDSSNRGIAVLSREELKDLVNLGHSSGMQVATHAIGDAAIDMVLDAYAEANRLYPKKDSRFRIVHASVVSPGSLDRFREQRVIADIQPSFIPTDNSLIDQHLGPVRAAWTYRWKDFLDRGILMGGGSDCPVENYRPLPGICAAVTRQDKDGNPPGGWYPAQKLSLLDALKIYTCGSAYCSFEENEKGTLTTGKLADMAVLSEDITAIEPEAIKKVRVDMTIIGGRLAYSSQGA